jgi:hypothetical protein
MRLAWSVVVVVASAPCSCEAISGLDGLSVGDASVDDASQATDAPSDGTSDAISEGGNDGGPATTWCSTHGLTAVLCDDFDNPGEKAGDNWTGGADAGVGALLAIVPNVSSSTPDSLLSVVPSQGVVQAALTEDLMLLSNHPASVAFDLLVAATSTNCSTSNLATLGAVARVGSTSTFAAVGYAMGSLLYIQAGSGYVTIPFTGIVPGQWVRVELDVGYVTIDGGAAIQGAVYLGDAGTHIAADAEAPAAMGVQPLGGTNGPGTSSATVGTMDISNSIACTVHIDNVVIFQ